MTAFFETRTPATYSDRVLALYFEDDRVALNAYREINGHATDDGIEIMIDRSQIDATIAALQAMRTIIDIRHPQLAIEALAVTA
jgi:hypothetical protein